jgi:hypothetical protein
VRVAGAEAVLRRVKRQVFPALRTDFPTACFALDRGRTRAAQYYGDLMLDTLVRTSDGADRSIADGGTVDWTQRLLSDAKERLLVSGIGLELLAAAR